ncbi:hypothetical protein F0L74_21545 [Chitinophaga agrisoli]|uniref:Uncharacterized protein n=1 Tax=Chitinophaga agrisoli TaxID=2607653 RepID=A0A5B2VI90_9BACT|nr:hypothetical protein [Chitinophaga agrisoli]KAA2238801.1 hypothetical protein F0L74_21545 [Chitinophaga agrisoli]
MKKNIPQRVVIHSKDIQNLTGKSRQYAGQLLHDMKKELGREKRQYITVAEFCAFTGITVEAVMKSMRN